MARVLFGIIAVVASLILVDSLTCNKCTINLLGLCVNQVEETCSSNSSVCFTGRISFPQVTSFVGLNSQGCLDSTSSCNTTSNGTLIFVSYSSTVECCSTDKCNPVTLSGAPSTKMTFTAAIGAAVLASVWGSML